MKAPQELTTFISSELKKRASFLIFATDEDRRLKLMNLLLKLLPVPDPLESQSFLIGDLKGKLTLPNGPSFQRMGGASHHAALSAGLRRDPNILILNEFEEEIWPTLFTLYEMDRHIIGSTDTPVLNARIKITGEFNTFFKLLSTELGRSVSPPDHLKNRLLHRPLYVMTDEGGVSLSRMDLENGKFVFRETIHFNCGQ